MSYKDGYGIKDMTMMQGERNGLTTKDEGLSWTKDLNARS
jgi:hypothetical protein